MMRMMGVQMGRMKMKMKMKMKMMNGMMSMVVPRGGRRRRRRRASVGGEGRPHPRCPHHPSLVSRELAA
jgi:hypothetical protein